MTEEEKTEGTPRPEDSESSDQLADSLQQDGQDGGEEPVAAEGKVEDEEEVGEPSPPAESDRDLIPVESAESSADSDDSASEPPDPTELPAERPKAEEKKVDVIPGADLEPIAVEPEAPQLSAEERARLEAEEEERARREAELAGEAEYPGTASRAPAQMESGARYLATGKRKNAIARVTLTPGEGKFEVNKRALDEFFPRPLHQTMARQSLVAAGYEGSVDVRVLVHGGGISGQAGAVRHGIARALTEIDPELRGDLKRRGFLTRDARVKERRKAGLKKARKRPQFSKR